MQLNQRNRLAIAAAGLISATHISSVSAEKWSQDAAVLYYGEGDSRVTDGSIKYKAARSFNEGEKILSVNVGIDTLTGASPSGVAPSQNDVIITSPSGDSTITHPAGQLPLDSTFKDTRVSLSAGWDQALSENMRGSVGGSFSKEYDYLHLGLSGGLSRELNSKNTTLSVGLAYSADSVEAVGNAPVPLSDQNADKGAASESKNTTDLILGVTQIVNKNTIVQLNYGLSQVDGYLNDPYKWVSVVDNLGVVGNNLHEARPNKRTGHNLYGAIKYNFPQGAIFSVSGRYHTDDWGIDSLTADLKYRMKLGDKGSIEPHLRFYQQTAADFYTAQLNVGSPLPSFASTDYRLAEFNAYTIGATYRLKTSHNREWRLTSELYTQDPKKVALTAGQAGLEANPGFSAAILSLGIKF